MTSSKKELIYKLLEQCHETNEVPIYSEISFALSVVKAFRSWNNGLVATSFNINIKPPQITLSNDQLIIEYIKLSENLEKTKYGASKIDVNNAFHTAKFPCYETALATRFLV